jgi:3-hydroxyacyl-CoA dehydrogenase/enoyl-CoA hydratase/3-hydroxybutyryl-CoA epimerase/3-hydroxyacyl-CoA dehydrogenase/enoyl-CoA hydratase/3-hydroxybutyryl-CoA epimerase/enoyl-CoA isomerase
MGAGIGGILARAGIATTIVDLNEDLLRAGTQRARKILAGRAVALEGGSQRPDEPASLLTTSTSYEVLSDCDVVIEAVTESEEVKTSSFRALAGILRGDAFLASNTSTIPISRMASSTARPERFAGMHFFHPAHRMELVEVIRGERTSTETLTVLVELARRLGKTPIVVRDCPGFLVTRVLFPYLSQALDLLCEGTPMDAIDLAAVEFGMPTGPIALQDFVGLDTVLSISRIMERGYPDRARTNPLLAGMAATGRLGQKTGTGFRRHDGSGSRPIADPSFARILDSHRIKRDSPPDGEEIVDRLFLPMLVEAVRALDEGVVNDSADVDLGVLLGLGFPEFRGGLLRWCDTEGAGTILTRLARYQALGPWFKPPATLLKMAESGGSFRLLGRPVDRTARSVEATM